MCDGRRVMCEWCHVIDVLQDVALVSLSNVLYRSGFDIDAAVVIHMSLEVSKVYPH